MSRTYAVIARAKSFTSDLWVEEASFAGPGPLAPWGLSTPPVVAIMRAASKGFELEIDRAIFIGSALLHARQIAVDHENQKLQGEKR